MGHAVTVFDEHEQLGGMMRYGIPGFRTPSEVLDAEIERMWPHEDHPWRIPMLTRRRESRPEKPVRSDGPH
jgi:hypothetical protein